MRIRVVILSEHSLFTEGLAARLRELGDRLELQVIEPTHGEAMAQIAAFQPDAVIMDASEPRSSAVCPVDELLSLLPQLRIIRLDPAQPVFQVVTSEERFAGHAQDLLEVIARAA